MDAEEAKFRTEPFAIVRCGHDQPPNGIHEGCPLLTQLGEEFVAVGHEELVGHRQLQLFGSDILGRPLCALASVTALTGGFAP